MKPHSKRVQREKDVGKPGPSKKKSKDWSLQYKWNSEKDFNTYPKWLWKSEDYSEEWKSAGVFSTFYSPQGALESIKKDLRSSFSERYVKGREWRVVNTKTNEIVEFKDIENFYKQ